MLENLFTVFKFWIAKYRKSPYRSRCLLDLTFGCLRSKIFENSKFETLDFD